MADDLGDPWAEIRRLADRVRRLESATPLQNASISRGALRVVSAEGLIVEGSSRVSGTLIVSGTFEMDGTQNLTGTLVVSGDTTITGDVTISGDFAVTGGGRIIVGSAMTLDPSVASGAIVFANGAQVFTDATTIQVYKGNGVASVSNTEAKIQVGGAAISVDATGRRMAALPAKTGMGAGFIGCLWVDTNGYLYRITS